uniref:Tumor protein, translationally-controlled 1 n=1 Tax=Sinocyclocheilus rhinocerous TaxID=307959 RepID=A0A673MP21_9TELE
HWLYSCRSIWDEMFSDIYKIKESENGMMIEVEGKGDIDDALIGGNASAEVQDEGCDSSTVSGVDIVLNHKLQETSYDKKSYTAYIKDYMKAVKAKLQEVSPDRVDPFMANAPAEVKKILGNIKNYQHCTFQNRNPVRVFLYHCISEGNRLSSEFLMSFSFHLACNA